MPEFLSASQPVRVNSFSWTTDGIADSDKVYWLININHELFLKSSYRISLRKHWTNKLKKAVLFESSDKARDCAKTFFHFVSVED